MHSVKLMNSDWEGVEDKMEGKLGAWQGRMMSCGPKLILLKSCLSSIPYFMMSMFPIPKDTLRRVEYFMKRLLWQDSDESDKYNLVKSEKVCQPIHRGRGVWE